MDLSVKEAAALLDLRPRTIRARLARGELPGKKKNGHWVIAQRDLPLTDGQRQSLNARADQLRQALDDALPSRVATTPNDRRKRLSDLNVIRLIQEARRCLETELISPASSTNAHRAARILDEALVAVSQGISHFDMRLRMDAFLRARSSLGIAVGLLSMAGSDGRTTDVLELQAIPALGGLMRWNERRRGNHR